MATCVELHSLQVNMTTEAAAHHISLSMSPCIQISCPNFRKDSVKNITLTFDDWVPESMFLERPLLSAGSEFGCQDESGDAVPMYLRVVSETPEWKTTRSVKMEVVQVNMTDFFVGDVDVSLDPNEVQGRRAQVDPSTSAIMQMHRLLKMQSHYHNGKRILPRSKRRTAVAISTKVVHPKPGCVYSTACISAYTLFKGIALGNYCPDEKDGIAYGTSVDLLSLSKSWVPKVFLCVYCFFLHIIFSCTLLRMLHFQSIFS